MFEAKACCFGSRRTLKAENKIAARMLKRKHDAGASTAFELRLALLKKGADAFVLIFG